MLTVALEDASKHRAKHITLILFTADDPEHKERMHLGYAWLTLGSQDQL